MKILWICPYAPLPTFGSGTRVFNLIRALGSFNAIDLIAVDHAAIRQSPSWNQLQALCRRIDLVPGQAGSKNQRRLRQARAVVSLRSATYWTSFSSKALAMATRRLHDPGDYDLCIIEQSFFAGAYRRVIPSTLPLVLDQHNVESDLLRSQAAREAFLPKRWYYLLDWRKSLRNEKRLCGEVDLLLATSDVDCARMKSWPGVAFCETIPNGVDTAHFRTQESALASKPEYETDVVFPAAMHYAPNVDAVRYFVEAIWPAVLKQCPRARFRILGGNAPPAIRSLSGTHNITVTPFVPDVRPYLEHAKVVIAPLRIGSGTRLKILEALSSSCAVVTTSVGCEGLDVEAGRHLLVADQPADFARSLVELLTDSNRREALGAAGRSLVVERYDWLNIGARLQARLQALSTSRND